MTTPSQEEFENSVEVVAGNPTKEELAAVVAVLLEASKQQSGAKQTPVSTWARNDALLRTGIVVGNGQWGFSNKAGL